MRPVIYKAFSGTGGVGLFFSLTEVSWQGYFSKSCIIYSLVTLTELSWLEYFSKSCITYSLVSLTHDGPMDPCSSLV